MFSGSSNKNQPLLSIQNVPVSMGDYFPRSLVHGWVEAPSSYKLLFLHALLQGIQVCWTIPALHTAAYLSIVYTDSCRRVFANVFMWLGEFMFVAVLLWELWGELFKPENYTDISQIKLQGNTDQMGLLDFAKINRVPITFIIAALTYMGLMMIDRAIYLRRNRFAKLVYHFMQVIGYHLWFFIMDPLMANRHFNIISKLS